MKQRYKSLCIYVALSLVIRSRKMEFAVPFPFTNRYCTSGTSSGILFQIRFRTILKTVLPSWFMTLRVLCLLHSNIPGFLGIVTKVETCIGVEICPVSYILLASCTSTSYPHSYNASTISTATPSSPIAFPFLIGSLCRNSFTSHLQFEYLSVVKEQLLSIFYLFFTSSMPNATSPSLFLITELLLFRGPRVGSFILLYKRFLSIWASLSMSPSLSISHLSFT